MKLTVLNSTLVDQLLTCIINSIVILHIWIAISWTTLWFYCSVAIEGVIIISFLVSTFVVELKDANSWAQLVLITVGILKTCYGSYLGYHIILRFFFSNRKKYFRDLLEWSGDINVFLINYKTLFLCG